MGMMLNLKDDQTQPMGTIRSGFDSSSPPRARCAGCMTCLPSRPKPKPSPACHARTVCTVLVIVLASASAFPLYSLLVLRRTTAVVICSTPTRIVCNFQLVDIARHTQTHSLRFAHPRSFTFRFRCRSHASCACTLLLGPILRLSIRSIAT